MDQEFNEEGLTQQNPLKTDAERTEGSPEWDIQETPEEVETDVMHGENEPEPEEISSEEEPQEEETQKNTPSDDSRRVLKFSEYFS